MLFIILSIVSVLSSTGYKLEVKDAWLRTGAEGLNSALYFTIENKTPRPDTLYKVSSDIAQHIMMHETYKKNDMMGMREIKYIVVKANSSVAFKPGSYHVMLMDLKKDLKAGNKINFILYFRAIGEVNITAVVQNR
jgi:copper(I)-binding protein